MDRVELPGKMTCMRRLPTIYACESMGCSRAVWTSELPCHGRITSRAAIHVPFGSRAPPAPPTQPIVW